MTVNDATTSSSDASCEEPCWLCSGTREVDGRECPDCLGSPAASFDRGRLGLRRVMLNAEPLGWSSDTERDAWYAGYDARVAEETRSTRGVIEAARRLRAGTEALIRRRGVRLSDQDLIDIETVVAAILTPPTDAGSTKGEVATFLAALADGSVIRETLAAGAIIDVMTGGKFDWRARINDSDFTSSADWMTALAYANAALGVSAPSDAGSTTREGGEGVAAGMKPWAGGPKPADWDGRAVQFRDGKVRYAPHGAVWKLGWDHSYGDGDIIAYSTKAALATTSSPDASPDSGGTERLADELDKLSSSHRPLLTAAANELRRLAASPASLSGGAEVTSFLAALTDGSLVREILAAGAIIDVMTGGQFDWRSRINDDDFTSSADWMTALEYARAVLRPSPEAPANRQEAGE